ncbi:autotransporter beta-domain protein [Leptotrichia trevisanii]|uniref:Autotransporter beta-domain protein n=1 Tax=Leptotrichia trevisanii TaxID=109328 RepID=A0A510KL10_9FUSO|nr:autotransporter-associated N-terminal domain-containing protein [Leptotrichia trevisanii]BBM52390.1 autotransporter beta-domain protein [Leptotrichia trevisanii]
MSKTLLQLKKDLKAFAKRCKDFKYTDSVLFAFLLNGLLISSGSLYAAPEKDSAINNQMQQINTSIKQIRTEFKRARAETDKLVKGTNLELIQLMEQGDHVTKSPWSSWQYGMNYFYNDWHGHYRGRGDKIDSFIYKRDDSIVNRSNYPGKIETKYGATTLGLVREPNAAMDVSAALTPKSVDKVAPAFTVQGAGGGFPNFVTRIVKVPGEPGVVNPVTPRTLILSFTSGGADPTHTRYSYWMDNKGDISGTSVANGEIYKTYSSITSSNTYNGTFSGTIQTNAFNGASVTPGTAAALYGGTSPKSNYTNSENSSNLFFNTLTNTPYSYFGDGTKIALITPSSSFQSGAYHRGTVINLETEGQTGKTFSDLNTGHIITADQYARIQNYMSKSNLNANTNGQLYHTNNGIVEIGGTETRYVHTTVNGGNQRLNIVENNGKIIGINYNRNNVTTSDNIVFFHSPDLAGNDDYQHLYANSKNGEISLYGQGGAVALYTAAKNVNSTLEQGDVSFINEGTINLYGKENVGVAINNDTYGQVTPNTNFILSKPINIYGDNAVGLYNANSGNGTRNDKNEARFIIGNQSQNKLLTYTSSNSLLGGSYTANSSANDTGYSNKYTEGVIGIYQNATKNALGTNDITLKSALPELTMEAFTRKSVGIYTKSGNVDIDHGTVTANKGKISMLGGEENVGLYASGGGISFKGDIEMGGSASTLSDAITTGYKNTAVYATNSNKVTVEGGITTDKNGKELTESTVVYANGSSEVILNGENNIKLKAASKTITNSTGNNTGVFVDDATVMFGDNNNGTPSLTGTTTGSSTKGSSITITSDDRKLGTALYAKNGGMINAIGDSLAKGLKITVKDGASAVASVGQNASNKVSQINVKYSTINYDGEGFALYTDDKGKINADDSEITLSGKAVGFGIRGTSTGYTSNVSLVNSKFKITSDDVILMNVVNPNALKLSNFVSTLSGASGLNASNITTNGPGAGDNYKLAVVEGLNNGKSFTFDNNLDKSLAVSSSNSSTNDYKYVRNFLIQRSILDVNADVKAVLSTSDATTINGDLTNSSVIGLNISSSTGAVSNAETGINVNGKTITVDRTDAGAGAIGLYTNFGKININSGTLNVETDTANTVNDQAVGVYAVNGSEVNNNSGNITVGGNNSIGILGLAYREDAAGNPVLNEFGGVAGQGKATVNNDGNITLDGTGAKGVFVKNNNSASSIVDSVATNKANGKITMSGAGSVGMYADKATLNNYGTIDLKTGSNAKIGMYGINNSNMTNWATGNITVGDSVLSSASDVPNIGMYTADSVTLNNYGTLDIKDSSYGMYGENIHAYGTSKIKIAQNGVGIFSKGTAGTGTVTLDSGSEITTSASVKGKEAVGVFTAGTNPVNINDNGSKMDLKDWTFGYVIKAPGTLTTNASSNVTMDNETVYAYSDNNSSVIKNYTPIKATGNRNYGIYSSGTVDNYGNMDLKSGNGNGNIGMYSTAGTATNWATIDVGKTDKNTKSYGIGMATGYYDGTSSRNQGTIINKGTINVTEENSIGMYAVGKGSKAINAAGGIINLSGKNTIGMYIDQEAEGENYGTITGNGDNLKGVVVANQGKFKNYGTIQITGNKGIGIYTDKGEASADGIDGPGAVNTGSFRNVYESQPTDEKVEGSVTIKVPPKATTVTVTINGAKVPITKVDTNVASPSATEVTVTSPSGVTVLDLAKSGLMNFPSGSKATSVGMYVDTSGIKYTNPIQGLSNLAGLTDINLYFGTEAARYTNAKAIELGDNIIKPYNDALANVVTTGTVLNTNSSSLTWLAIPTKSATTGLYDKVYLVKIPYTDFVSKKDPNTYNFLNGLEQRYGVEGLGTREKELFNKLNDLGKGEQHIFTQAVDEMKGHQYANVQQRINATRNTLDNEFGYLRNEWRNPSKQNNKIKVFGTRDEYNTDTAGIIDYKSNAYGVAYVHEDEKIKMGNSSGWYAGAVTNRFRFKDLGKSKEDQTMIKLGIFKTMSPKTDHNGALQWTIAGDVFTGVNSMKRKFWIVDDVFEAKSTYHSYGAALKNELGYDIRLSERTHLRPFGSVKMEYGRFNSIKEDSGQMRLKVKGNDYFSVKPEAGMEFKYVQPLAVRTNLTVGLSAAYENEIGKLQKGNRAKVRYTTADWYNLEKEKEDRRGNGKFDLNIGVDNRRFGVTVNTGYDTKGNNVRGGIGFRAIY